MQFDFLGNQPQFIPTLAQWQHAMWGHLTAGATVQARIERLANHAGEAAIPTTVVAFADASALGSASLVQNDLSSHPHLGPFLASVYVDPPHRRRGIASALVTQITAAARQLNVATLYLITPDQQSLYARLGWQPLKNLPYRGEDVTLMSVQP